MTVSMIDLLKRSAPFLITALALSACTKEDGERLAAFVKGDDPPPTNAVYLTALPASSSAEASSVEPVVIAAVERVTEQSSSSSVAPPPCDPIQWRGNWYSCDMMVLLGPVE